MFFLLAAARQKENVGETRTSLRWAHLCPVCAWLNREGGIEIGFNIYASNRFRQRNSIDRSIDRIEGKCWADDQAPKRAALTRREAESASEKSRPRDLSSPKFDVPHGPQLLFCFHNSTTHNFQSTPHRSPSYCLSICPGPFNPPLTDPCTPSRGGRGGLAFVRSIWISSYLFLLLLRSCSTTQTTRPNVTPRTTNQVRVCLAIDRSIDPRHAPPPGTGPVSAGGMFFFSLLERKRRMHAPPALALLSLALL